MRRALAAALAVALTCGGSAWAQPAAPSLRAPHVHPAIDSPEAGIWDLTDRAEAHARAAADLDRDPELTAYVRSVALRLAPEYAGDLRVYVLDRPFFQAQCAPNGYIEVWSGLMLRVADEDELAFVLGHEISHFARNHTLAEWTKTKHEANVRMAFAVGVSAVAAGAMYSVAASGAPNAGQTINNISYTAQNLTDLVYLASVASIFSYGREQESEADALGFGRAIAAGYRPQSGSDIWEAQIDETRNSDFKRIRESETRGSIFRTHPLDSERIAALRALETHAPPSQADRTAAARAYRARIRPHLAAWLADDLRRQDFGQTLHLLDRLDALGEDRGVLAFARGEVYRKRREDGDDKRALKAYREAVAAPDAPAEAWREAGEAELKSGDRAAAKLALAAYVDKRPDAADRWMVDLDLKTLTP